MPIIIGSQALAIRAPNLLDRSPGDWDFIMTPSEARSWMTPLCERTQGKHGTKIIIPPNTGSTLPIEIEIATEGYTSMELYQAITTDPETLKRDDTMIPSLDALFAIKTSHRYLKNSPHFWKNLGDWHAMKGAGAKITARYKSIVRARAKETYTYAHPTLMGARKDGFFTSNVKYIFDHDTVHQAIARMDNPAYTYYMVPGADVECDPDRFFSGPLEIRINGALEEAGVLAVERSLVPFPDGMEPYKAWLYAFSKVCTSITSGWFRKWCYEQAPAILKASKGYPFWEMFQAGLSAGVVKPYQETI